MTQGGEDEPRSTAMSDTIAVTPALHQLALRLAYELAGIAAPVLQPHDVPPLTEEYYRAIVHRIRDYENAITGRHPC
jgi:hypothetical protein